MAWLLDTNVLSELRRSRPEPRVVAFVAARPVAHPSQATAPAQTQNRLKLTPPIAGGVGWISGGRSLILVFHRLELV